MDEDLCARLVCAMHQDRPTRMGDVSSEQEGRIKAARQTTVRV
jgi:hypothetical protein